MISKSSSPFIKPLGIIPSAPIAIDITVTFMFQSFCFFLSFLQGLGTYLSFRFLLFLLCGPPVRESPLYCRFSFFFIDNL